MTHPQSHRPSNGGGILTQVLRVQIPYLFCSLPPLGFPLVPSASSLAGWLSFGDSPVLDFFLGNCQRVQQPIKCGWGWRKDWLVLERDPAGGREEEIAVIFHSLVDRSEDEPPRRRWKMNKGEAARLGCQD